MEDLRESESGERSRDGGRGLLFFIVFAIIVLIVVWLLLGYVDRGVEGGEEAGAVTTEIVLVPDVVGLSESEAIGVLDAAGFGVESMPTRDAYADPDSVLGQGPAAGTETVRGITVTIDVATRPDADLQTPEVTREEGRVVPDVVGRNLDAAESYLDSNGFGAVVTRAFDEMAPAGKVVAQSPVGGTVLIPGELVSVVVSLGKAPSAAVSVPGVVGMSESEARALVESAGLTLYVVPRPSPPATLDRVWEQWPETDALVEEGSQVTVIIGSR